MTCSHFRSFSSRNKKLQILTDLVQIIFDLALSTGCFNIPFERQRKRGRGEQREMSFVNCLIMQNQAIRRAEVYTGMSQIQ